jgi:quinoprotein glucose dehydrogenase
MIYRRVLEDRYGKPCTPTPWGATAALDLNTGKLLWRKPLGTLIAGEHTGTVNYGAPIVTAGGLLFTAASSQPLLRAIDKNTGEELWTGKIPVPAQSTPMTYMYLGRQYVVVDAGGHGGLGTTLGDSVIAFALPRPDALLTLWGAEGWGLRYGGEIGLAEFEPAGTQPTGGSGKRGRTERGEHLSADVSGGADE